MKKLIITICTIILLCSALVPSAAAAQANSAPQLLETSCVESDGNMVCLVQFKSTAGKKYRVYRRVPHSGKYTALGEITAKGKTTQFTDKKAKKGAIYFYTVRMISGNKLSAFDKKGIKVICFDCAPTISLTTQYADIRFKTTPEASSYLIYRKFGNNAFKQIGKLSAQQAKRSPKFKDNYYQTLTTAAEKQHLLYKTYVDPTANPFRYEVRAIYKTGNKISRGYYSKTGTCVVGTPALSSVNIKGKKAEIVWAGIPVAKSYNIYAKVSETASWEKLAVVSNNSAKEIQSKSVTLSKNYAYFTVRAFANSHGKLISGNFEKDFRITNRNYTGKKALFVGDSITRGTPTRGDALRYFSFPIRVQQLLGIRCDNLGIPAATIVESTTSSRQSVLMDELVPMHEGARPNTPAAYLDSTSLSPIWQYDYFVIEGGTNDYGCDVPIGTEDSQDTKTFSGALNRMRDIIISTNAIRAEKGLAPVKVIVLDITFSCRFGSLNTEFHSRFTTPNKLGLTALDYNKALHQTFANSDLDVTFVNSNSVLNEKNCLHESADNLHFTKLGYGKLGKLVAKAMM